ncbi:hypothetical protein Goklo_029520, partial [Gossypium klotzschianum]|nr:hypothetical protein [Gossypium klotzschianum]
MDHLFRKCPVSELVWSELSFHQFLHDNQRDFSQWLTWVFSTSSTSQCRIFCYALWAIWGDRNARVHKKGGKSGKEMAGYVQSYITELNEVDKRRPKVTIAVKKWRKPPDRIVKINFDGAYDDRQKRSAVGIVAKDREGTVLLSCAKNHHRISSAFEAEAPCTYPSKGNAEEKDKSLPGRGFLKRRKNKRQEK